jgi:hypothetical protein
MSAHTQTVEPRIHADTVFEGLFGRLLEEKAAEVGKVDGIVQFTVLGEGGGCWSLDLRKKGTAKVYPGYTDNPDLNVIIAHDLLGSFLKGDYDIASAIAEGRLALEGDLEYVGALADFLHDGGGSSLDVRANLNRQAKRSSKKRGKASTH